MQKLTIIYLPYGDEETTTLEFTDIISCKENYFPGHQELLFSVQDAVTPEQMKELAMSTVEKISMQRKDADGAISITDFSYTSFEKITQDFRGTRAVTSFQTIYPYNN